MDSLLNLSCHAEGNGMQGSRYWTQWPGAVSWEVEHMLLCFFLYSLNVFAMQNISAVLTGGIRTQEEG